MTVNSIALGVGTGGCEVGAASSFDPTLCAEAAKDVAPGRLGWEGRAVRFANAHLSDGEAVAQMWHPAFEEMIKFPDSAEVFRYPNWEVGVMTTVRRWG